MTVIPLPKRTYRAKLFEAAGFKIAGTLEGCIDLATPSSGTYLLTLDDARQLIAALYASIDDVRTNSLYDRDALLVDRK